MTCVNDFVPQLHAKGLRMTPQRMAILHVLRQAGGHMSPTQVYRLACKETPRLTEPTVYRTLEHLAAKRLVLAAHVGNGKFVYELTAGNHHHLICRDCRSEIEIDHAPLDRLYHQLESSTGYKLDSNHVTLFGLCPDCQKANEKR
jgi:Fe2+ or Zn2+ uptake regulation protein